MRNAISIQKLISQNTAVQGIDNVIGIDKFFTPPLTFQTILKNKDNAKNLMTNNLPEFVTDELDKLPKNYLLAEYPESLQIAQLWLTDPSHPPVFSISSQSVQCQKCQDVIKDFPDILKCRRKVSSQTVFSCQRYK